MGHYSRYLLNGGKRNRRMSILEFKNKYDDKGIAVG